MGPTEFPWIDKQIVAKSRFCNFINYSSHIRKMFSDKFPIFLILFISTWLFSLPPLVSSLIYVLVPWPTDHFLYKHFEFSLFFQTYVYSNEPSRGIITYHYSPTHLHTTATADIKSSWHHVLFIAFSLTPRKYLLNIFGVLIHVNIVCIYFFTSLSTCEGDCWIFNFY